MRLHPGKGQWARPRNPLPDVLGWKYSGNRSRPTEKPVTSLQPLIESFTHPNAIIFCIDRFRSRSTCIYALIRGLSGIELLTSITVPDSNDWLPYRQGGNAAAANDDWFMPEAA